MQKFRFTPKFRFTQCNWGSCPTSTAPPVATAPHNMAVPTWGFEESVPTHFGGVGFVFVLNKHVTPSKRAVELSWCCEWRSIQSIYTKMVL